MAANGGKTMGGFEASELESGNGIAAHGNGSSVGKRGLEDGTGPTGGGGGGGRLGRLEAFFQKTIWHGGSVYDAWLNAVSAQVLAYLEKTQSPGNSPSFHFIFHTLLQFPSLFEFA